MHIIGELTRNRINSSNYILNFTQQPTFAWEREDISEERERDIYKTVVKTLRSRFKLLKEQRVPEYFMLPKKKWIFLKSKFFI